MSKTGAPEITGLVNLFKGLTRGNEPPLQVGAPVRQVRYYRDEATEGVYCAELDARPEVTSRILVGGEIQTYVDEVLAMPWPRWRVGPMWPATVRIAGKAEYGSGIITVPSPVTEPIVLHEIAHHFTLRRRDRAHYPPFGAAFIDLLTHVMNPAKAAVFADHLRRNGIAT